MARVIIRDRVINPNRVDVERQKDGLYLVGLAGVDFHDVTRSEWDAINTNVIAGFDAADAHHTDLRRMGVA
jgi:hypothetical protein